MRWSRIWSAERKKATGCTAAGDGRSSWSAEDTPTDRAGPLDRDRHGRGATAVPGTLEMPADRAEVLLDCTAGQYSTLAERFAAAWNGTTPMR